MDNKNVSAHLEKIAHAPSSISLKLTPPIYLLLFRSSKGNLYGERIQLTLKVNRTCNSTKCCSLCSALFVISYNNALMMLYNIELQSLSRD